MQFFYARAHTINHVFIAFCEFSNGFWMHCNKSEKFPLYIICLFNLILYIYNFFYCISFYRLVTICLYYVVCGCYLFWDSVLLWVFSKCSNCLIIGKWHLLLWRYKTKLSLSVFFKVCVHIALAGLLIVCLAHSFAAFFFIFCCYCCCAKQ